MVRGRIEPFDDARNPGEPSERDLQRERGVWARLGEAQVLKARFLEFGDKHANEDLPIEYPREVKHCGICIWDPDCAQKRIDDDHLSLVAWRNVSMGLRPREFRNSMPLPLAG